jgi:hypothetical protein
MTSVAMNALTMPSRTVVPIENKTGCLANTSTAKPKMVVAAEIKTEALVAWMRGGWPRHSSSLLVARNTL